MELRRYEVVLMDADGTLFDYDRAEEQALALTFAHFGLEYDPELHLLQYRAINVVLWRELELGRTDLAAIKLERFRRLFAAGGIAARPADFSGVYLGYLGEGAFLMDGAEEVCAYLASTYRVAVLTNGIREVQLARLSRSGLDRHLAAVIVSGDVGYQKPDPRIFAHALGVLGHDDRKTVIMVGDSLSADIHGGQEFGIDTCWFNRGGTAADPGAVVPTYQIGHLRELFSIL